MEREATQPQPSSPDYNALSHSNKRRRTRDQPTKVIQEQSESSNAPAAARRTLGRPSPEPNSSREMTPAEGLGAIKYTRTGRVSRANKGKRVHLCEDCGKVSSCPRITNMNTVDCVGMQALLRPALSLAVEVTIPCSPIGLFSPHTNANAILLRIR